MARTDVIVLGAGIVGTSVAVHLLKRGLSVALVDRGGAGEGTSYGNAGIIEGNTIFPAAFPSDWATLLRIALKRSPLANYHLMFWMRRHSEGDASLAHMALRSLKTAIETQGDGK